MRDWLRPASGYMAAICSSFEKVDILVRSKENVGRENKEVGGWQRELERTGLMEQNWKEQNAAGYMSRL